jgi:cyclohexanone monooxygenase
MRENDLATLEATPEAVEAWRKHVDQLVNATVLSKGRSWFLGDNIPGKPHVTLFHFGGAGVYRHECLEEAAKGFKGFVQAKA